MLSIVALVLLVLDIALSVQTRHKVTRVEMALRSYCSGLPKLEACVELDLPLSLDKFK